MGNKKTEWAKNFLNDLIAKKNPRTHEICLNNELLEDDKIISGFNFVYKLINDYEKSLKEDSSAEKANDFSAGAEFDGFPFDENTVTLSQLVEKINSYKNFTISGGQIRAWLMYHGLIMYYNSGSKTMPTALGNEYGLKTEERTGENTTYTVTTYNVTAQEYVLSNIEEIITFSSGIIEKKEEKKQGQTIKQSYFDSKRKIDNKKRNEYNLYNYCSNINRAENKELPKSAKKQNPNLKSQNSDQNTLPCKIHIPDQDKKLTCDDCKVSRRGECS
ncbi:MAG: hypothetical protein J6Z34_00190, partial [Clostridia bacterium]|nr:hypothetical protein [Clostridia bacterium]